MSGLLFVVSAASGTGKTSLVKALLERVNNLHVSVPHTTRGQRPGELDGVHYHFSQKDDFLNLVNEGGFIEYAEVFGNYYGTAQATVKEQLAKGHDVLLEIDWQGAQQVRHLYPDAISIFVLPPSIETLELRLNSRGQDSQETIAKRVAAAREEMSHVGEFDYVTINHYFEEALQDIRAVIRSRRLVAPKQLQRYAALIETLT